MWHMKTIVILMVVGALGIIRKGMVENIKKVSETASVTEIQKISMGDKFSERCVVYAQNN